MLAATQRAHELDDPDVYREIMRNPRVLYDFHNTVLPVSLGRNFSVRMYTASPSITVYRWDDKALVSFFPIGKISSQGAQLEVTARSPLGEFLRDRFNSLWTASKDLKGFMHLPVTLVDPLSPIRTSKSSSCSWATGSTWVTRGCWCR